MKQLFRHTSTLLRSALLLGAMAFVNIHQTQAQTAEQLAAMPNAFEIVEDPNTIIGNGQYYYIQFYHDDKISYLTDCGLSKKAGTKDFLPSNNRLWTMERVGDGNQFKLKSKNGYYIGYAKFESSSGNRYGSVASADDAVTFEFQSNNTYGYSILDTQNHYFNGTEDRGQGLLGRFSNKEWNTDLSILQNDNTGKGNSQMHIAQLKSNVAYIIYYRGEEDGAVGNDLAANAATTRHYLTYSGTTDNTNANWRASNVSSRRSIIPSDKPLCTLPTIAAYHQDGLWTLEGTGKDGEFYIKKYGTEEYLNPVNSGSGWLYSDLGTKDEINGKYVLQDPIANRYTLVRNKMYSEVVLASTMFNNTVYFNVGTSQGAGATVVGTSGVDNSTYADLTGYTKMLIKGDENMQLRVLMNRLDGNGYLVERNVTIGSDGTGVVDLTGSNVGQATVNMTYVNYNSPDTPNGDVTTALCGYNKISMDGTVNLAMESYGVNNIAYLKVDASTISGTIRKVTLVGDFQQINERELEYGVGYNNTAWSSAMTWNTADRSITTLGGTQSVDKATTDKELSFDITGAFTASKVKTILVYNLKAGAGYIKNARVYVEYEPDDASTRYVHLNAIKTGWSSPSGTISSITMLNEDNENMSSPRYLDHAIDDGWEVLQWDWNTGDTNNDWWYAGFYPVEVPVPNKDNFYQVLVKWGDNMINHNGGVTIPCPTNESDYDLWQLEMVDDYKHFRLKAPDGRYLKPNGTGMTPANDPTDAEIMTNEKFWTDFSLTWFFVNPVAKEIPVDYWVTHRESYLKQYSETHSALDLAAQGLATKAQSDWWNYGETEDDPAKDTQKVNHFEITHYVKQDNTVVVEFPTVLNKNNDHVYFQRFYNYDEKDYAMDQTNTNAQPMDLANLKAHVSLDTRDDGNVQYFLYKNGMVTGQKLKWKDNAGTDIPDGGMARNALRRFNFINSDGKRFTVGVDVSRYSDLTYKNSTEHLSGDLEEPSLTMRYVYYMRDAREMAASLTACPEGGSNWLETKEFHFPARRIGYELEKKVGYQGEFIGVRHVFSDYWVFDDPSLVTVYNNAFDEDGNLTTDISYLNSHLVSAVDDNTKGKIEVEIVDNDHGGTGIRLGGWNPTIAAAHSGNLKFVDNTTDNWGTAESDFRGFYFYDKMSDGNKTDYGNSRFVVFRYPEGGVVSNPTYEETVNGTTIVKSKKAYVNVYLNNNGTRYQLAQYTIIFDPLTQTLPWKLRDNTIINPGTPTVTNPLLFVKDSYRDPKKLVERAGKPIAKITFDYPAGDTYHFPAKGQTKQGWVTYTGGTLNDCSPIPLTFGNTNYSFMGFECNWGSYSIVNKMTTNYGNHQNAAPANDNTSGYGVADVTSNPQLKSLQPDDGLQNGFLYIDASEQPGDICSAPFIGDFCSGDKLMFSGWISGSNKMGGGDNRCPGGVTLTVKGERNMHDSDGNIIYDSKGNPKKEKATLYRFCPGQCYELDDGPNNPDGSGLDGRAKIDDNGVEVDNPAYDNYKYNVIWQQFYFEFIVTDKYDRHWIEVNNNCVSSQGGDFMLDNIEVYAIVPEVKAEMNTPICLDKDGNVDMRLLKLTVDFNKLVSSSGVGSNVTADLGFVFIEKDKFLKKLKELKSYSGTTDQLADAIKEGNYILPDNDPAYRTAFDEALLRSSLSNKTIWKSSNPSANKGAGVMYFQWNSTFESPIQEQYTFLKAVERKKPVFRDTDKDGVRYLIMNGNYAELPWKINTDYYIVPANTVIDTYNGGPGKPSVYETFNICSSCSKASVFQIAPPYHVLGLESSEDTHDLVVCEGQIPTLLTDLKGFDYDGNEVPLTGLNFDWWLGDKSDPSNPVYATLENYHVQNNGAGVKLDKALSTLRWYYPEVNSLDGLIAQKKDPNPELTLAMLEYLQDLVDKGQLVLHQKSISVPAVKASDTDPYFYLVACPIHDGYFDQALNHNKKNDVAYFCDEPQGLRIKVGEKAPLLKTGFVPGENNNSAYNYPSYPADSEPVLSIRLAKKAQFETVKHGDEADAPAVDYCTTASTDKHFLWLPIRNAQTQTANSVIRKSADYNIYLASTNDPTWDKKIYTEMKKEDSDGNPIGSLPIVGKIVYLYALNTIGTDDDQTATFIAGQKEVNRLCVYFTGNFDVREGYNYTLSLPFQEEGDVNTCDGTILLNLKIVPDYEVWTGAAGNTDWNNDENWRRADGNPAKNLDELYVEKATAPDEVNGIEGSPLYGYKTNAWNYRTPKDQLFRKGFAPLYCTHILLKSDEWGNAPVLYEALDGKADFDPVPFPNLRDATATAILRYDMQARKYDDWEFTYGLGSRALNKGRNGDLLAEMYQINSCDEIVFQPGAEMRNAHLLNYNSAWVEYQLDNKRWYLLGSPLQGTIAGEWYAPTGTAKQQTTYYDPVTFGPGYDRYSPAIYQRSWDKAKSVLYEVGSTYNTTDNPEDLALTEGRLPGSAQQGYWDNSGQTVVWNTTGADEYLDRLGYKPMGEKKVNVAMKGIWSNTYNDATVDYTKGGFSVMVMNHLKGSDGSGGKSIIRLPKEDLWYYYYEFSENGSSGDRPDGRTDTELNKVRTVLSRNQNRGRLKTDQLLPPLTSLKAEANVSNLTFRYVDSYGDRMITRVPNDLKLTDLKSFTEGVSAGVSNMGYYLVENPFPCGLNMDKFFAANTDLEEKYWLLTATGQHLVQKAANGEWISPSISTSDGDVFDAATRVMAPGQGFFVQAKTAGAGTTITFNNDMQAQSRYGVKNAGTPVEIVVGTKQKMETKTVSVDDDEDPSTPDVQVEVTVPMVDEAGNYVLEDQTEFVTVYKYDPSTAEGETFPLKARTRGEETEGAVLPGLVITAKRGDTQSSALVMQHDKASNDFLPSEDTETFITSDLENVPTVYTLCGRLATTINSIHDFRSLPVGVESNSEAPCTLTFKGVELLGDSISFYDAVEQKLTPLTSGMTVSVSGQTQNRYYLVRSLDQKEAAEETHLQIFTEGLTAKVIASTAEPITSVRCYDTAGRLIHSATPQTSEYSFTLPTAGIYIINAETDNDRKTVKLMAK